MLYQLFGERGVFIGFLGGFTTFSSFSFDTVSLFQSYAFGSALANIGASLILSFTTTAIGLWLGQAIIF
ncbi:fluoride efflux transporter FluC [Coxiella-like endosymbiont]|uniref:fluoride efflux transporter FluC n=1 Tax=Coxiella-like endosymbiont TaxID=1592897 RepID=UPI0034E1EC90